MLTSELQIVDLRQQLADREATLQALIDEQIDAVTRPGQGTVLLREAQEALRRQEETFRALIERSPDLVCVHRDGAVVYVNPTLAKGMGAPGPGALVGLSWREFFHPDDRAALDERLGEVWRSGRSQDLQCFRLMRADGSELTGEFNSVVLPYHGIPAIFSLGRDVTARREMEARLRIADRMVSVGTLAAGVAHEVNNPLAYVISNLEFLANELGTEGGQSQAPLAVLEALRDARDGADRVRAIVRELKTFSRPTDEGRVVVAVQPMLEAAVGLTFNQIRHRARLVKNYSAEALCVLGNEGRLSQVFLNLIVNAAQAIAEGAAERNEVRITTRAAGDRVDIEVRDTGGGMTPEVQKRIFDPFFTTKPVGVGTGLGLSICHNIVSELGGTITVSSTPGVGSVFTVSLPRAEAGQPMLSAVAPAPASPQRGRVLVIDDEPLIGRAIQRVLSARCDVTTFGCGRDALARLREGATFDLILCDLMMPEMTGMEVYEHLAAFPDQRERVVFLTGGAFTERARSFLASVGAPHLDKPFSVGDLLELVARRLPASPGEGSVSDGTGGGLAIPTRH